MLEDEGDAEETARRTATRALSISSDAEGRGRGETDDLQVSVIATDDAADDIVTVAREGERRGAAVAVEARVVGATDEATAAVDASRRERREGEVACSSPSSSLSSSETEEEEGVGDFDDGLMAATICCRNDCFLLLSGAVLHSRRRKEALETQQCIVKQNKIKSECREFGKLESETCPFFLFLNSFFTRFTFSIFFSSS